MKSLHIKPGFKLALLGLGVLIAIAIAFVNPYLGSGLALMGLFGTVVEETDEAKALKEITNQVKEFKKDLGDKASKEDFASINKALKELKDGLKDWSGEKIETKMKEVNDLLAKINTQMTEMAEDVAKAKESGAGKKPGDWLKLADVKAFIDATFKGGEKSRTSDARIKIDGRAVFARKAAEDFGYPQTFDTGADTQQDAFTGRFIDPTLYQRKRKRNLILDHFAIESITVPKLLYLIKREVAGDDASSEDVGGANWITSGESKPKRSFRLATGTVEAKKLAVYGNIEDKLLRDVPSLENWIREDLMAEMRETYNDGLLNNDPDGGDEDAPLGLKTDAIQFAATDAFDGAVADPNYIDAILAVAAYQSSLKEITSKIFVADDVYFAMLGLKDNNGRYQNNNLVYVNNQGKLFIAGVEVVRADAEDVPSTHILAIAEDVGFKIKNYGPVVFERGLNGNDFREDKTSYRGYQEVLSYVPEHKENTVLYDTWSNVFAAIIASS